MGYLGLEPRTYRLKAEYSTIELVTLFLLIFIHYYTNETVLFTREEYFHFGVAFGFWPLVDLCFCAQAKGRNL
jgi:hypothetical protein